MLMAVMEEVVVVVVMMNTGVEMGVVLVVVVVFVVVVIIMTGACTCMNSFILLLSKKYKDTVKAVNCSNERLRYKGQNKENYSKLYEKCSFPGPHFHFEVQ